MDGGGGGGGGSRSILRIPRISRQQTVYGPGQRDQDQPRKGELVVDPLPIDTREYRTSWSVGGLEYTRASISVYGGNGYFLMTIHRGHLRDVVTGAARVSIQIPLA